MIELAGIDMQLGRFSLRDVSLSVADGKYAVLMGRTGCGKTSLLEAICGLRRVSGGAIRIAGVDMTHWSPADRGIGYVPQDLALFPTLTVAEHLQFALRLRRWTHSAIESRTAELASVLGIEHLLGRRVQALSGGEAQRTALGRAISFQPQVLLLDEPLSALDDQTRQEMFHLLRTVKQATGVSTLHVTHNQQEADELADVRFQLIDGKIVLGS
ncbi:MAG: ABC transporter ATP-binding protein [Planctomycetales bacterium]|nr:ABC transporter ATP-binding protein [Planctomycetales bacterium]